MQNVYIYNFMSLLFTKIFVLKFIIFYQQKNLSNKIFYAIYYVIQIMLIKNKKLYTYWQVVNK
jgi:hypothetical protein